MFGTIGAAVMIGGVMILGAGIFGEIFEMAQARTPASFQEMCDDSELAGDEEDTEAIEEESGPPPDRSNFPVKVGDFLVDAMKKFDPPKGRLEQGRRKMYSYPDFRLISEDGRTVAHIEFSEDYMTIQSLDGDDYQGAYKDTGDAGSSSTTPAQLKKQIATIKKGGKQVSMKSLIVPGKVTVVDFYADWCMPCKVMSPKLEKLANNDSDVFLRKVDIVNWNTPVANQYDINTIPLVCVYNRKGTQVGSPTSDLDAIEKYIAKAK